MSKPSTRSLALALMLVLSVSAGASAQQFATDVNTSIDRSLAYYRANLVFTTNSSAAPARGLLLLCLLEKRSGIAFNSPPNGYNGSSPADQLLEQAAVKNIIEDTTYGVARGGFYAYPDGQNMMSLSEYASTGGPDVANSLGLTTHQAITVLVNRTLANQSVQSTFNFSHYDGFWGYTGPGDDSSTTQYAAGGLSAASSYYTSIGDPDHLVASITAALALTRGTSTQGYMGAINAIQGQNLGNGVPNPPQPNNVDGGWGYHPPESYAASYAQTASGTWASILGGADLNDNVVQRALHWQQTHYNYQAVSCYDDASWPLSNAYFIFSFMKALSLLQSQGTVPNPGNLGVLDLGTLAASAANCRLQQRNPLTDVNALTGVTPGSYSTETPRPYYDFAYTIMTRQNAVTGQYTDPNGDWEFYSNQAYYTLTLQRSLGGVNSPPDCTTATPSMVEIPADPAHGLVNVSVNGVTDPDGDTVAINITSIQQDEALNSASTFAFDGAGVGTSNACVRAERLQGRPTNPGNGRVYTIGFTGNDGHGASCSGTVMVGVPFNNTTMPVAILGPGPNIDSTAGNIGVCTP
jgi:hypothetical protein